MKQPVRVAITGAAGQIAYELMFRIAGGHMLGPDQPVILQMLEIPDALGRLKGVMMELEDCALPLLHGMTAGSEAGTAFRDADIALLVGARPRGPGMERSDLLEANGAIFREQGRALNENAARDVKVLVVGNPANTNALIAMSNAPDLDASSFTAMTRLDHNRAIYQLAAKAGAEVTDVAHLCIWGNHSTTQYPDVTHATVRGKPAMSLVDQVWVEGEFVPRIQKRGAEVIHARGSSSAASAAHAAVNHVHDWVLGTGDGEWVSMAIRSDGSYGVPEGLIYSFPVTTSGGEISIVGGLEIDGFSRERLDASARELESERAAVQHLLV